MEILYALKFIWISILFPLLANGMYFIYEKYPVIYISLKKLTVIKIPK